MANLEVANRDILRAADLDYVVFFEKPFVKFERLLLSNLHTFPRSYRVFREAMVSWLSDNLMEWTHPFITGLV